MALLQVKLLNRLRVLAWEIEIRTHISDVEDETRLVLVRVIRLLSYTKLYWVDVQMSQ